METIGYYLYKFKWHIIYLISGFLYCYFLDNMNRHLLSMYEEDDYWGMLKNDSQSIISFFLFALVLIVLLAFLIGYTIRNAYILFDDVTSIVLFFILVILTIILVALIFNLIYVPIFKAIMFGLFVCGFIGAVFMSN